MGRPRKGVVQRPDGQWTVSLPIAVGSKQTRQFTDPDETAVRRWYADGERALAGGHPLPDPAAYRTGRPAPALTALAFGDRTPARWWAGPTAAYGHRFDKVAEAFLVHHYNRQRSGQPERRAAVVAVIDNDLKPFLAGHQVSAIEAITHELVGKLAAHLAALDAADEPIWGRSVSTNCRTSGGPNRSWTIAFISVPFDLRWDGVSEPAPAVPGGVAPGAGDVALRPVSARGSGRRRRRGARRRLRA
jgi:hypothetical protein